MSAIEPEALLAPISPDAPAGEDLVYDPSFQEMLTAAERKPERRMGDSAVPGEEPDWKRVRALALDLFSRTKDLRIGVMLTKALLHTDGLRGLKDGLGVTRRLLEDLWDSVHPQLDPEDNNDPTERVNALLDLCERETLLNPVRTTPLIRSRVFGPVSVRDLEIAEGKASPLNATEGTTLDMAAINGAFLDCELEELRASASAVADARTALQDIEALITARVGAEQAPELGPLSAILSEADSVLQTKLAERPESSTDTQSGTAADQSAPPPAGGAVQGTGQQSGGEIRNRDDVVRTLDKICDFYAGTEPSSPVPLLLQRARRLVTKDFMEIVRDLAPEAMKQIEAIRGPETDKKK